MIYLDYAATTPCAPEVVEAMLPFFTDSFANASSIDHMMGSTARKAVDDARTTIASLVGAKEEDLVFTSGSTEANNLVLWGTGRRLVLSAVEHPSVLEAVKREPQSALVLPVTEVGRVRPEQLAAALGNNEPSLVSVMHTNNETGARNDLDALATVAHEHNALFHSDLTQGLLEPFSFRASPVDAASISAHKIYGPKGVGALIAKPALRKELRALTFGGGHERGFRSGTLNVTGIVGFGMAAKLLSARRNDIVRRITEARAAFLSALQNQFRGAVTVNGDSTAESHILSVRLHGINNRALLTLTAQELCFALGSACATNKNQPSHVLRALGLDDRACNQTIRVSFGLNSAPAEMVRAATLMAEAANSLLNMVA